jgi:hypothetical protein
MRQDRNEYSGSVKSEEFLDLSENLLLQTDFAP